MDQPTRRAVEATTLRPEDIVPHPLNPRESDEPDEGLVASVKEMGVRQRLLLAPVPDDLPDHARRLLVPEARFLLIAGHRRLRAALEAELEQVPVDIDHGLDTTEAQLAVIAAENIHRADLTALEEGDLYLALGDLGLAQRAIAERTGVDKGRVSERTRVAKLPGEAREKVASHQVTLEAALTLAKVADDPEDVARIAAQPAYLWESEVAKTLRARDLAREAAQRARDFAAGVTVLDEFPPTPDIEADPDDPAADATAWWRLDDLLDACYDGMSTAVAKHLGHDPDVEDFEGIDLDFEKIEAWHQDTCPGHAVVRTTVRSWQGEETRWVSICTAPTTHDDLVDTDEHAPVSLTAGPPTPGRPEAPAETEEERAHREHLAAREVQRAAWAVALIDGADDGRLDEAARKVLAAELQSQGIYDADNEWAASNRARRALTLGLPEDATAQDLADRYAELAEHGTLAQLVVTLRLIDTEHAGRQMARPGGWDVHWAVQRTRLFHALGWLWDEHEEDEIRRVPDLATDVGLTVTPEDDDQAGDAA